MSNLEGRVAAMFHPFLDASRKGAVRDLARDVGAMEARIAELERELEQAKADRARAAMDARNPLMAQLAELEERCKRLEEAGDALERDKQTFKNILADLGVVGSMGFGSTVKWAQAKEAKP